MRAFADIRVLDLTHVLAGPFATAQLALLGADVIKIESPRHPDMVRAVGANSESNAAGMGSDFQAQASNKRSLNLDLADHDGAALLRRLVATADVLVENYQAGSLERLGLGYDVLREINPGLIYCSVSGFGHDGPHADRPAYDATIKAASGYLAAHHRTVGAGAMLIGPPVLDYATGAMAAFAISSALLRRERTGEGQRLDVSMFDAALTLLSVEVANMSAGETLDPTRWDRQGHPGYRLYDTADGVVMAGAWTPEQTARFWEVLGYRDRAEAARAKSISELEETPISVIDDVQAIMISRTAAEWESDLLAAQVPASRVRTLAEAIEDPQAAFRNLIARHPGGIQHPTAAFVADRDGPAVTSSPPQMGAETDEILAELGIGPALRDQLRERGVI
jgi:crotonobetainyl-CoA:carnitine CoA-transferase CaiB-like acyl-CoA transferase